MSKEYIDANDSRLDQASDVFWRNHLFIPLACFILLATLFEISHADLMLADWLYRLEGGEWFFRHDYIFSKLMHKEAKHVLRWSLLNPLYVIAITSIFVPILKPYRRAIWYLVFAISISTTLATYGKDYTHVDCPWDVMRYGGTKPYIRLFEPYPGGLEYGHCFPAGHASGGYALLAFYFFFLYIKPAWRYYGMGIGIVVGMAFGISQQLRGAHFLSHDLWTIAICWFNGLAWYWILLKNHTMLRPSTTT